MSSFAVYFFCSYSNLFCFAVTNIRNILLGLSNCDDVLSIYVGDDRTDEDAFKVRFSDVICNVILSLPQQIS